LPLIVRLPTRDVTSTAPVRRAGLCRSAVPRTESPTSPPSRWRTGLISVGQQSRRRAPAGMLLAATAGACEL